jgi:lysozyme
MSKARIAAALLSLSAVGFAAWQAHEGFTAAPVIPTRGDVPTIGHGSTRYEDGTPVRMTDPPITRERGAILARNLMSADERKFRASIPGVKLHQEEFDLYMDFVGQYGVGNWRKSSMRARLMEADYRGACRALLLWKRAAGYDCSTPGNKRCWGVWQRQLSRYEKCMAAQ